MKTTNKDNLNKKLIAFQREIGMIAKDSVNPHFKNSYASLQGILSEVKPILNKHGLILSQPIKGTAIYTEITDSETQEFTEAFIELPTGLNPQQLGSAITYYRRYLLAGILSLEIGEDDDGTKASEADTRAWLNDGTPPFAEAVKFLQAGNKIEAIEKKYKLSTKVREKLLSEAI